MYPEYRQRYQGQLVRTDRASLAGAGSGIGVKVDSKAGRGTAGLLVMAQGGFLDGSPAKSSTS